jgi:hypothetical protein
MTSFFMKGHLMLGMLGKGAGSKVGELHGSGSANEGNVGEEFHLKVCLFINY